MSYRRMMIALVACVLSLGLVAVPAYAANKPFATTKCAYRPVAVSTFDSRAAMVEAANAYFKNSPSPVISSPDLYAVVQAKDVGYEIVDIRSAEAYALGHIDGAINIPFRTIADDASLARLDATKKIVAVGYTGESGSMTNILWNMLGYKTTSLMYGMSGWVADPAIVGSALPSSVGAGYATVTKATVSTRTYRAPRLSAEYTNVAEAVKGQARAYFAKHIATEISVSRVHEIVESNNRSYQIVSVRQTAAYATGHIKGATNIVWTDIADQMTRLDPRKTTIVYCYTGNTAAQASMFLNLMGYETYNMTAGMSGWNRDPAVGGTGGYDAATVPNYPTVK